MSPHLNQSNDTPRAVHTVLGLEKNLNTSAVRQIYSMPKIVCIAGVISFNVLLSFPAFSSIATDRVQPTRQTQTPTTVIENQTSPEPDGVIPAYCYRSHRGPRKRIRVELPECRQLSF
jgi:hypothetical protein